ncbi:MAG: 6,7-dimethyl-8-ribityllumazine synthase [Candidatus Magasanikbacteria bacterium]|jgi:6,7-dimethyl-8-ribityllumazine synthase|nr:6,7-dimethyl-8-ribityllumazine synthase [Candidatus Magasanikbacteria bacterium]
MGKGISFEGVNGTGLRIGIVVARWNSEYTYAIRDGVLEALKECGVAAEDTIVQEVPGAYEVVLGGKYLIESKKVDAVVCIGTLIKGETLHFEYISEAVTQGLMRLQLDTNIPVIYGVLNTATEEQAHSRSVGEHNHGRGWGFSAVEMASMMKG